MSYWLGVILAIGSGIANNVGTLMQKKVVNDIPSDAREERFFRTLVKDRLWLLGLLLQMAIGTAMFMLAQVYIGPALIPGLMAAGLIVLAIGSVKLIGESINKPEAMGITLLMAAIVLITLSEMVIDVPTYDFLDTGFLLRIFSFTFALTLLMLVAEFASRRRGSLHAVSRATVSGLLFALSNYWIAPMMGTIVHILEGTFVLLELGLFAVACITLVLTNVFGIGTLQDAFKTGQANLLVPIQQVPIQITPGLVYLFVFLLTPPTQSSLMLFSVAILLIIASSFLLGRRQILVESIQ
ncbi:MAG: DMT family transporter [Candidatus Sifarchaeia archaeon]